MTRRSLLAGSAALAVAVAVVMLWLVPGGDEQPLPVPRAITIADIVPAPVQAEASEGVTFAIPADATIVTSPDDPGAAQVGAYLADMIGGSAPQPGTEPVAGGIALLIDEAVTPAEAYELDIAANGVTVRASTAAGLFWGVQTLRQLIPGATRAPVTVTGGRITDAPRFAYRGVMLDVARHFFEVSEVQRLIDLAVMYKVNHLHLHLTDDQGWRIAVDSWPRLTEYGGGTEVGDGPGGYYTKDDYRAIVEYAAARFVTVVPEIDLPGHTNAALASYPELTCDGVAPPRYTGIEVGFSALCPTSEATPRFLADVLGELAAMTPGPYLHIGGDEVQKLSPAEYAQVVNHAQAVVAAQGKTVIGWHDIGGAALPETAIVQFWGTNAFTEDAIVAAQAGNRFIMSPADRAYLDQKYQTVDRLGLMWAGPTTIQEAYDWEPTNAVAGISEAAVLGVEAPLWTETVTTMDDIEYLVFPRLVAVAEIGWSPESTHDWNAFRNRLGAQMPRWLALDVDFARVEHVPWVAA
jgi:hexosaminidase